MLLTKVGVRIEFCPGRKAAQGPSDLSSRTSAISLSSKTAHIPWRFEVCCILLDRSTANRIRFDVLLEGYAESGAIAPFDHSPDLTCSSEIDLDLLSGLQDYVPIRPQSPLRQIADAYAILG